MRYNLRIPARINILGNPADGNEGDFATISAAVNVYAGATVEPSDGLVLESLCRTGDTLQREYLVAFEYADIPLPYTGELDLVKGAINRLHRYSAEFREKFVQRGVKISTWTDIPRQSGLGGSSVFVLLTLAGLRAFYDLDPKIHNDYMLGEITQRVEDRELHITCGFADRYVPLFGGLAYLDYRGKLYHRPVMEEPLVTYERLDPWVDSLPLVAVSTGIVRDSGDVHGKMRPRYIEEYNAWLANGGQHPPMVAFMHGAWETAWRGKIALLHGDLETFGRLMNENHRWVNQMMEYCGFTDGAGWANNILIETALENGALGAKLTGAGGGGSVFALVRPGEEERLMEIWEKVAAEAGLDTAQIYRLDIVKHGLTLEACG